MSSIKKIIKYIGVFLTIAVSIGHVQLFASAEDNKLEKPQGFFYEVKYPENQQSDTGYYDLKMKPGQKQTVQIMLRNLSDKELTVVVSLNGAKTNSNGVLEYGPSKIPNDASLKYDFQKIVTAPEKVILAPKEDKNLDILINMPEASFDGLIAGGIQLHQESSETDSEASGDGTSIVNKYAYLIALLLQETEVSMKPELAFNKVEAGQSNYRNAVFVNMSNIHAAYLNDLTTEVKITKEGSEEVLYETKKSGMKMAPNSFINFPVSLNGDAMRSGNYEAHILATSGDQKWEWKEAFNITKEQADQFNQYDLSMVQKTGINWWLVAGATGILFLIITVFYTVLRHMSKKKSKKRKRK